MSPVATPRSREGVDHDVVVAQRFAMMMVGIPALGTLLAVVDAQWHPPGLLEWTLFGVMFFITTIGIEGGFHRFFSHKCCQGRAAVVYGLGITGSMAAQGPLVFWVATHLMHHQFSDRAGDPHSPCLHQSRLRGISHAQVGWLFEGRRVDLKRYALHLIRRHDVMFIHRHYLLWVLLGLAIPAAIAGFVEDSFAAAGRGLLWGGMVRIFVLHHLTWAVNSLAHQWGSRPYSTPDNSRNLGILALPTAGGSWHNNHHAFPAMARNDHHWWQIDIVGYVFEGLAAVGLVTDVHRPAQRNRQRKQRV